MEDVSFAVGTEVCLVQMLRLSCANGRCYNAMVGKMQQLDNKHTTSTSKQDRRQVATVISMDSALLAVLMADFQTLFNPMLGHLAAGLAPSSPPATT